jgi:hypothetical protein
MPLRRQHPPPAVVPCHAMPPVVPTPAAACWWMAEWGEWEQAALLEARKMLTARMVEAPFVNPMLRARLELRLMQLTLMGGALGLGVGWP